MMAPMPERRTDSDGDRAHAARSTRRVAIGATVGAIAALLATSVLTVGSGADEQNRSNPAFDAPAGACLDWTAPDGADVRIVDCAQPHLFEGSGSLSLTTAFGPAAAFPAEAAWVALVQEKCTPLAVQYLGGGFDPFGRFTVGALKPSQPGWRNGDRVLRCGLQVVARSGELYRVRGAASGQDQADVHPPGTCLGINGVDVADPVSCDQPHAIEVVGVVDLAVAFPPGEYPAEAKQDEAAGPECTRLAAEYAGGPTVVAEKKLTVYWDTLRMESWAAGTRKIDCKLGALLPDKSGFAPVTGGVRGVVTIAQTPALSVPPTATPGAPAPDPPPLVTVDAPATVTTETVAASPTTGG